MGLSESSLSEGQAVRWALLLRNGLVIEPSCLAGTVSLRICHKLTTKQDQPFLYALPNPDPFCAKNFCSLLGLTRLREGCIFKKSQDHSCLDYPYLDHLKFVVS